MNRKQIQLEVCKAMLDTNRRLCKATLEDNGVMITTDGYQAFIFNEKECIFDLSKIPERSGISSSIKDDESDEELRITNKRFIVNDKTVAELKSDSYTVYANVKLLNNFKGYHLYTNKDKTRVVVKDDFGIIVGMFCVMRFREGELIDE